MINNLNLPKSIKELSSITNEDYPVEKWSGAVVMLLVGDKFAFIRRSETMPSHKGQIGFIGGHKHDNEIDPLDTAIREFCEESGFVSSKIKTLGLTQPVWTSKRQLIIPILAKFLGTESEFLTRIKSNGEWDDIVLAPVSYLKEESNWTHANVISEKPYAVYFCPLTFEECRFLNNTVGSSYVLWGASAKMVLNFFQKHMVNDKNSF
ncbi:MAG: 8-oxo-dGTP pyrophosphatase MutT (NUDIX family) [Bacteriovoracaceae bacterium]|jgi:8-oxo-dGTP pyrophosphatase MutT (NUDIX family)